MSQTGFDGDLEARIPPGGREPIHVARDLGVHHETLRKWVRQTEADEGKRSELLSSEERERLKALERENTQELDDHGVLASVGSAGDAYDYAMAKSFVDTSRPS